MRIESRNLGARHLGRDRWIGRGTIAAVWVAGVVYYLLVRDQQSILFCGAPFLVLAATAVIIGWNHGRPVAGMRAGGAPGHLVIDGDRLEVWTGRKVLRLQRADVVSGWAERWEDGEHAVLATRSGLFVRIAVPSLLRGRDVLQAAGVAPDQRAAVIRLGVREPGVARAIMIFLAMIAVLSLVVVVPVGVWALVKAVRGHEVAWSMFAMLAVAILGGGYTAVAFLIRPLIPSTVRIGTDGVVVERLYRKRLIRRAELERVLAKDNAIVLVRKHGSEVEVPAANLAEAKAVAGQIERAMEESGTEEVQGALIGKLDRAGRGAGAWLKELRALAKAGAYREAAFAVRDLLDVVKDGAAPADRRIAAAAALSDTGDEQIRVGLRIAAQTCVDDRVRIAVEKAAEGELEEAELERLALSEKR